VTEYRNTGARRPRHRLCEAPGNLTVLLLDDQRDAGVGEEIVETDDTLTVVGTADRVADRSIWPPEPSQVAVIDVNMPDGGGWPRRAACARSAPTSGWSLLLVR